MSELKTYAPIEWCPGCGNFGILSEIETILMEMKEAGEPMENIIILSGVGNHAKIVDYINVNSFYTIHGRAVPAAEAIKLAKPGTKVICFVGDGDGFAEGLSHLIFAAKRNVDITVLVHDNRAYALATGQFTPTSQSSYIASTMPEGAKEVSFNPLELMMVSGATFIARGYPLRKEHFKKILREAINHKGFSVVDILQVCITFNNLYKDYNEKVEELILKDTTNRKEALKAIRSWDYSGTKAPIPVGVFYQEARKGFEDYYSTFNENQEDREKILNQILDTLI
ncbi:MAG: thiamine pyrophosphate-dependent enzyme [Firmicutes bacterium]|nr:thiamine pyrophosphate-dependent enzyme [Bacillota bacterium]